MLRTAVWSASTLRPLSSALFLRRLPLRQCVVDFGSGVEQLLHERAEDADRSALGAPDITLRSVILLIPLAVVEIVTDFEAQLGRQYAELGIGGKNLLETLVAVVAIFRECHRFSIFL